MKKQPMSKEKLWKPFRKPCSRPLKKNTSQEIVAPYKQIIKKQGMAQEFCTALNLHLDAKTLKHHI